MKNKIKRILINDDTVNLKLLKIYLHGLTDTSMNTFAICELCMKNISGNPDIIILDYQLNGIEINTKKGIATLDDLKKYNQSIPIIIQSKRDKLKVIVYFMLHKSYSNVLKSKIAFLNLMRKIKTIFHFHKIKKRVELFE